MESVDKIQVEFTDRYDGKAPSWLRGCFGCQAMGIRPIKMHHSDVDCPCGTECRTPFDEADIAAYQTYLAAGGQHEIDGWYFLRCPRCHGTGRVSWLRTICRIPRWLYRGIPFIWYNRRFNGHVSQWGNICMAFKCAYLSDLGLWRP